MLSPDEIEALGNKVQRILDPIIDFLIADIVQRISEAGQMTSTAQYQVWRLQQLGISQRELKKELRKRLKLSQRELGKLLYESAEDGYNADISRLPSAQAVPFVKNKVIQDIVDASARMASGDLDNITQTIGMVAPDGKALPLTKAYQQLSDFAFTKVATGAQDYNSAVRDAVRQLINKGIQYINYESGQHCSIEAAVRRNVMATLGNMQEQISQRNHDDLGADGWEISAHGGSAPDHEPIQGKQYSDAEYKALNNSLVRRIGTLNCGHAAYPIILGVSQPVYSSAELEKMRKENEDGVTVDGKHYTIYEATQFQRQIERAIRKQKRKVLVEENIPDSDQLQASRAKLTVLSQEYSRFSKAAGLRTQIERTQVANIGKKASRIHEDALNGNTVANLEYIGSAAYRSKFSGLFKKDKYDGVLCKLTRRAIKENNGLETESYAFVSDDGTDSGLLKSGRFGGNLPYNLLEGKKKNSVVFTHNHPKSTSFSSDDINTLINNQEIRTMIAAGHDGTIYKLSIGNGKRDIDYNLFSLYNDLSNAGLTPHEVMLEISSKYGWRYECV